MPDFSFAGKLTPHFLSLSWLVFSFLHLLICFPASPQIDLAPYVGASLDVMKRDAAIMREGGPTIFSSVRHGTGVQEIKDAILSAWRASGAAESGKPVEAVGGKGKEKSHQ